jgi:hypothetical protein
MPESKRRMELYRSPRGLLSSHKNEKDGVEWRGLR